MSLVSRLTPSIAMDTDFGPKASKRNNMVFTEELCRMLPVLTTALAGGASIAVALAEASEPATGALARAMREVQRELEEGESIRVALAQMAVKLRHRGVSELVSKLTLASSLGTPVVTQLQELARTEQQTLDQHRLRFVAKAETRMLIPLVFLILPVSVLFALYPSLSILQSTNYR